MKIEVEIEALTDDSYELTGEYRVPGEGEYFTHGDGEVRENWTGGLPRFILRKKFADEEVILLKRPTVMDLCNEIGDIDGYYSDYSVIHQSAGLAGTAIHNLKITVDHLRKEVWLEGISDSEIEGED